MSEIEFFFTTYLNQFQNPWRVIYQTVGFQLVFDRFFQLRVRGFFQHLIREQIGDQRQEKRFVLVYGNLMLKNQQKIQVHTVKSLTKRSHTIPRPSLDGVPGGLTGGGRVGTSDNLFFAAYLKLLNYFTTIRF